MKKTPSSAPPPAAAPADGTAGPRARRVEIDEQSDGQRIDNFLLSELKGAPRTLVYRILRSGEVRLNSGRAKPSDRVHAGDIVRIPPLRLASPGTPAVPGAGLVRAIEDAILYEDEHLLVLNKPAGLAVHGGSGVSLGVIEALRQLRPHAKFLELVHRLDRDTSGCLVIAKKRSALLALQKQMRGGSDDDEGMGKIYLVLVKGRWKGRQHRIEAPLQKNTLASGERMVRVSRDGKQSITEFEVIERFADCSLVEARLLTGRTHQIRVHCQHAGHPVGGDPKYGDEAFNRELRQRGLKRMFLHAMRLDFSHPADERAMRMEAPPDAALTAILATLRATEAPRGD
ncbi:MAG: 23S rRNA pseudouridine(955/2504/2580) synthase RluC [Pseudomonadota bacterium]